MNAIKQLINNQLVRVFSMGSFFQFLEAFP